MNCTESNWYEYKCLHFDFQGREAILVCPKENCVGIKWLLKTEYFGAFPNFELEMLKRGYHLAYLTNITRWHDEADDDAKKAFCEFLHHEFALHEKCLPVGMSCGGMLGVYFAAKYPEHVAALYLDAPVMNLLSCPAGVGEAGNDLYEEFYQHKRMTISELINYRNHPIDCADKLLEHKIPIFIVAGDSDDTVPYVENGKPFYEYYRQRGGEIFEIIKQGCGHHPHGLEDSTPLIEFTYKYYV